MSFLSGKLTFPLQPISFWKPARLVGVEAVDKARHPVVFQGQTLATPERYGKFVESLIQFFRERLSFLPEVSSCLLYENPDQESLQFLGREEQLIRLDRLTTVISRVVQSEHLDILESLDQFLPGYRERFNGVVTRLAKPVVFAEGPMRDLAFEDTCTEFRAAMTGILGASIEKSHHEKWGEYGALTREAFDQSRRTALSFAQRVEFPCAQLFMDLDSFKKANDRYGQIAGDYIIGEFFRRIRSIIRPEDLLCAAGGDEAIIFMPNTDQAKAVLAAIRIQDAVLKDPFVIPSGKTNEKKGPIVLDGEDHRALTLSVGIGAVSTLKNESKPEIFLGGRAPCNLEDLSTLLEAKSERAMKAAKCLGRHPSTGRFVVRIESQDGVDTYITTPDPDFLYKNTIVVASLLTPLILAYLDAVTASKAKEGDR